MRTFNQLISETTVLSNTDKAILIDKVVESMEGQIDQGVLSKGIQTVKDRIAEIDRDAVQTIPGDIALAQVRQRLGQ